jgi:DNA-binding NarL/FixJ family response regulator
VIRTVVVDDQVAFRTGLRAILESASDIEVVGEASDGVLAVAAARTLRPDVIVMDVRMPTLDGIEAARRIGDALGSGAPRMVMITTFDVDDYVYAALRAGASGFLLKDASADELIAAVRTVHAGAALLAPTITRRLIETFVETQAALSTLPSEFGQLTDREREVFVLVARGRSNTEIARLLFIAEQTVKSHVGRIMAKLGLRDRVHAVVLGYETGLITPGTDPDS